MTILIKQWWKRLELAFSLLNHLAILYKLRRRKCGIFKGKSIKLISSRRWYRKTKPYLPLHVTNCLIMANKSCHRDLRAVTDIPLSQLIIFLEVNRSGHGTSSTFEFLNHLCPLAGKPVAELRNSSFNSSWMSLTLALHPSNVRENCWATARLKASNFSIKTFHPFLSSSSRALSNNNNVWTPLGYMRTTGAIADSTQSTG